MPHPTGRPGQPVRQVAEHAAEQQPQGRTPGQEATRRAATSTATATLAWMIVNTGVTPVEEARPPG